MDFKFYLSCKWNVNFEINITTTKRISKSREIRSECIKIHKEFYIASNFVNFYQRQYILLWNIVFQIRLKKKYDKYRSTTTIDKDVTKARYQSDINEDFITNHSCLPTFCTIKNIYRRCTINFSEKRLALIHRYPVHERPVVTRYTMG